MPEPILMSIAAALAARSARSLYELVRRRFTGREEAEAAFEAAAGAPPDSPEVAALAGHLAAEEARDPAFSHELRRTWQQIDVSGGSLINRVKGNVSGQVVQARDVEGDINFGGER